MNYANQIIRDPKFSLNLKKIYWFSAYEKVDQGSFVSREMIIFRDNHLDHTICPINQIKIPGIHNLENILAAVTIANIYGIKKTNLQNVIQTFPGLPYRMELIREIRRIKFFNDTTSTTPTSTIASLESFIEKNILLIAGGSDKNLDFKEFAKKIKTKTKKLFLFPGEATEKIRREIQKIPFPVPYEIVQSMDEAVQKSFKIALPGDNIILSPGAASFGLFQNEFDRGDQFNKIVKNLFKLKK